MALDRATDSGREWFAELLPSDPEVTQRKMFGNVAGFVNGNMFHCLYGDDIAVRLSPDDRAELSSEGGTPFAPMPDRPMKEYVVLPHRGDVDAAAPWVARSLHFARALPSKSKS
jgi:TfoX/Sxy family transcriptional regulator of competence genes